MKYSSMCFLWKLKRMKADSNKQSTETQELRKVTSWLTEDTSFSSNTVQRYQRKLRDGINSSEKTTTK